MNFAKLYRPALFNAWQFIALTGLLMTLGAALILRYAVHRPAPEGFNWLYVCWAGLFAVGSLLNLFGKPDPDGHHH